MISPLAVLCRSADRLHALVSDAVLIGGTNGRLLAGSDRVLVDLQRRCDLVLDALDSDAWVLNREAPGRISVGALGGIEVCVRRLVRRRPLETERVIIGDVTVVVPTAEEALRIRAYLLIKRNQARDYLDCAELAERFGRGWAANTLASLDAFYGAGQGEDAVASQVALQLAAPFPVDAAAASIDGGPSRDGFAGRDWVTGEAVCRDVADRMVLGA